MLGRFDFGDEFTTGRSCFQDLRTKGGLTDGADGEGGGNGDGGGSEYKGGGGRSVGEHLPVMSLPASFATVGAAVVKQAARAITTIPNRFTDAAGGVRAKGKYNPKFGDGPRVALCMGNTDYPDLPNTLRRLPNCVNDAEDMGNCFEHLLGFDPSRTIVLKDANRTTIMKMVREMRDHHIEDGSLVGFFFSGHGVDHEGVSYLLPLGMTSYDEKDLPEEAVSLDAIMRMFNGFTSTVILMLLDCCREDDRNGTFKSKGSNGQGTKGFGEHVRSTGRNAEFLVGSACDPGTSAYSDNAARNSRYTEALLRHLPVAGRRLEESMKEVTKDVFKHTGQKQRPWYNNCMMQDVVLVPG